jgi:hypothetical protein
MALNIELFKKIRDRIAEIPESYKQSTWYEKSPAAPCGTSACLAGEAIICAAPSVIEGIQELKGLVGSDDEFAVPNKAADLLGLEGNFESYSADMVGDTAIFYGGGDGWSAPFSMQFRSANSPAEEAKAAVDYLDHIIATGSVE